MQATIMYKDEMGGIYRVVMPDGENLWYDSKKELYNKAQVRTRIVSLSIPLLLSMGYVIVGKVNNFKPKL